MRCAIRSCIKDETVCTPLRQFLFNGPLLAKTLSATELSRSVLLPFLSLFCSVLGAGQGEIIPDHSCYPSNRRGGEHYEFAKLS